MFILLTAAAKFYKYNPYYENNKIFLISILIK